MQINNKFRIFGIIVGVLVLAGLVGVMALTVQRAQELTSTVTRPKAAGTGACTGTTATDVGFCGGGGCQGNCACGCPVKDSSGNWSGANCKPPTTGNYSCQYTPIDIRCYTRVPADCGQFTSESVCVSYPGCSWGGGSSGYTATSPIGGTQVSSLTPTFSWSGVPAGAAYQVICVGTNSSCNFPSCTADFGPSTTSYTMTSSLVANTQYYWMVYSQPGTPAPTTGCQSFRTGAAPVTYYGCVNKTCAVVSGATANANGCTAAGGTCCSGASDCATGQTCDTTKTPNSCVAGATHLECVNKTCASVNGAGDNKNGCATAGGTCCTSGADCSTGQSCDSTKVPNTCTTISNEANTCWGNGGTGTNAGRCYDCNGDGTVNILDFSCFRLNWLKPVQ